MEEKQNGGCAARRSRRPLLFSSGKRVAPADSRRLMDWI
jgi:hypothetical protein